jgi:hypothetical protein
MDAMAWSRLQLVTGFGDSRGKDAGFDPGKLHFQGDDQTNAE